MDVAAAQAAWFASLQPGGARDLFEHIPGTLYFAKDRDLRLMAGNRAFVVRCGFVSEEEMVGHDDREIFPSALAEKYRADDRQVIETGEALVGIVELFPNPLGEPEWFLTDKIPLFDRRGRVAGLCGTVRSYEAARASLQPYLDLAPVTDYLKQNYSQRIGVEEIARMAGMSVRQLQRRFRDTFKTTPQRYVLKLRILAACELLEQTRMPITEIALQVGFYDHSAFSRTFSAMIGMPPRDFRQRYRAGRARTPG
jgi:AraC-like DNA-binding protein